MNMDLYYIPVALYMIIIILYSWWPLYEVLKKESLLFNLGKSPKFACFKVYFKSLIVLFLFNVCISFMLVNSNEKTLMRINSNEKTLMLIGLLWNIASFVGHFYITEYFLSKLNIYCDFFKKKYFKRFLVFTLKSWLVFFVVMLTISFCVGK